MIAACRCFLRIFPFLCYPNTIFVTIDQENKCAIYPNKNIIFTIYILTGTYQEIDPKLCAAFFSYEAQEIFITF